MLVVNKGDLASEINDRYCSLGTKENHRSRTEIREGGENESRVKYISAGELQ